MTFRLCPRAFLYSLSILLFYDSGTLCYGLESPKLTPLAAAQLGQSAEPVKLWLFFDSTQWSSESISITDKALARRAKVDPVGLLIDNYDKSLRPEIIDSLRSAGLKIRRHSRWLKAVSVEANSEQIEQILPMAGLRSVDLMRTHKGLRKELSAEHPARKPTGFPSSYYGPSLLQNNFIRAVKLHDFGLSGRGVLIAMFDSGFKPSHRAFDSTSLIATWDFINDREAVDGVDCPNGSVADYQDRHGTATWSVIGALMPDTLVGVAYGADFALAKTEITCDRTEIKVEEDNWIAAAEWADSLGADIISSSLGYYVFSDSGSYTTDQLDGNSARVTQAADIAASKNILVVTSAGNERNASWGTIIFPADGDSVLAVGAVDSEGRLASFSSGGPTADGRIKPDIVSLGVSVYMARSLRDSLMYASGTSFSAPLVAGGAALAFEHDQDMTAAQFRDLVRLTGDQHESPDNDYGYGLFDAMTAADILKFDPIEPVRVRAGEIVNVPVTTSGRSTIIPQLSGLNLPSWISLADAGDGTAQLQIEGHFSNLGSQQFSLAASIGLFEDTTSFLVTTLAAEGPVVRVGPNPFTDSVRIIVDVSAIGADSPITVFIFNAAGEKVREIVNIPPQTAETVVWDALNSAGRPVAPGVYLIRVQAGAITRQLKLLKIK